MPERPGLAVCGTAWPSGGLTPPFLSTALRLPTGLEALLAVPQKRTQVQTQQGLGQGQGLLEEKLQGVAPNFHFGREF